MQLLSKNVWENRVRRQVFPPSCSWPGCCAPKRIWRRAPMILVDGRWVCSYACLEPSALDSLEHLCEDHTYVPRRRVPLGLLMLSRGYIDERQLRCVLAAQDQAGGGRFGAWAMKLQFVTERQILTTLSLQLSCPILALQTPPNLTCAELIPRSLLRSLRMMPVRFVRSTNLLYVAVCGAIEHAWLTAIEKMLHYRIVPCLVDDRRMDAWLENEHSSNAPHVQVFEETSGAAEIARILTSYAGRLGADDVRIVRCGPYIWVRCGVTHMSADLLFRITQPPLEQVFRAVDELAAAAG